MEAIAIPILRDELLGRRRQLEAAASVLSSAGDLTRLLRDVDAALGRMDAGTFGHCETCADPIEPELLRADPTTRYCLDHLTPVERRALQQDFDLAAKVQRELLPKHDTPLHGWEMAYHYQPAGAVSGDYCDLIRGDGGDVYFLLGDVAGKGVPAAMLMSHLNAMLRTLVTVGLPLGQIMERASRVFCESTLPMHYASLVCCRATRAGELEICNAGHPPPLVIGADGVMGIDATGVPIGLFCSGQFPTVTVQLAPGDALLLYSDGLIEAEDAAGEDYGTDRLRTFVAAADCQPKALVDACVRDVTAFRGGSGFADDLTILAISRL